MKIKQKLSQHRRDFEAIYICENCDHEYRSYGYDDRNFHDNVIPEIPCPECNKTRIQLGIIDEPTPTRYPEGMQV